MIAWTSLICSLLKRRTCRGVCSWKYNGVLFCLQATDSLFFCILAFFIIIIPCTGFRVRQHNKHFAWGYWSKRNTWRKDDKTGTELVWDVMGHRLLVHIMFNMWRHISQQRPESFSCVMCHLCNNYIKVSFLNQWTFSLNVTGQSLELHVFIQSFNFLYFCVWISWVFKKNEKLLIRMKRNLH